MPTGQSNSLSAREPKGIYLGFKPPEEAAEVLASADALLSVMSFEKEHELFMRTSFTTKFLDYVAFGKPVILWGPSTARRCVLLENTAVLRLSPLTTPAQWSLFAVRSPADTALNEKLSKQALQLHQTLFNPDRLQAIFVGEIEKLVATACEPMKSVCLAILNYNGKKHLEYLLPTACVAAEKFSGHLCRCSPRQPKHGRRCGLD